MTSCVKVKICGLKRRQDIEIVNRCLPDYVGFVFAQSRRNVTVREALGLISGLTASIKRAGVFVNEEPERVADTASACGLDAVQIHGDESPEYFVKLRKVLKEGTEIWKAFRVKDTGFRELIPRFNADRILLDSWRNGEYGGSGKTFDWQVAGVNNAGIILAGGLNHENVIGAIRRLSPYMVDVSSGVETDGCKDEEKIKNFITAVRNYRSGF